MFLIWLYCSQREKSTLEVADEGDQNNCRKRY
jgi:hypothetical protein